MVKVAFLHPDLGIGGAERAVIDAALALKSRGHSVTFVTAHHDSGHCFPETVDGSFDVRVVGDYLPRSIFGKFYALCAYIRMIYAAVYLVFFSQSPFDVVFCDQISACIPVLKLSSAKILFYCHFPDLLLTTRQSTLKKLYRAPLDWLEEKTTGMADRVLVNSRFTAGVFRETFSSLGYISPEVLYPIPDFSAFDRPIEQSRDDLLPSNKKIIFLSINRFERKKNLNLAVEALGKLKNSFSNFNDIHLIMAGGYDERVHENKEYYQELCALVDSLGLKDSVTFLCSCSDAEKRTLLKHSSCLLYTPDREHFGIVPIEAMYMKCPVIAVASGGPLETVEDGVTGFLCQPTAESFALAMEKIVRNVDHAQTLGAAGHVRVKTMFSFQAFADKLDSIVSGMFQSNKSD